MKMAKKQHPNPDSPKYSGNRTAKHLLRLLLFISFALAFTSLCSSSILSPLFYPRVAEADFQILQRAPLSSPCSAILNNSLCCDRSAFRTDICFMRGNVRTHSPSNSVFVHSTSIREETIRPYTRKWETNIMATVNELRLRAVADPSPSCDVVHRFPAIFFSTGGYTGNVFHEFNDGILPLYLTAHHYGGDVLLFILDYHSWWVSKYAEILSRISRFPPINFSNDSRTHCFPSATVGLRIHDDLTIDPARPPLNNSILGFRRLVDDAYRHRLQFTHLTTEARKPKLTLVLRNGSRAVENEGDLLALAEGLGFEVEIVWPRRTTELASIYRMLNGSEVMIGVHGAAMAHFLFMRPGTVLLQIVPLGTEWAAEQYFGAPARRMGLRYVCYKVKAEESSLWRDYGGGHPVVRDPGRINARGWEETKRVYLDRQNVKLDLGRLRRRMESIRRYVEGRLQRRQPDEEAAAAGVHSEYYFKK